MDDVVRARHVAVHAAQSERDLAAALPALLHVTRDRDTLASAVVGISGELAHQPDDRVLRRARAILVGAMNTADYPHVESARGLRTRRY
jgi:hypothetical protein